METVFLSSTVAREFFKRVEPGTLKGNKDGITLGDQIAFGVGKEEFEIEMRTFLDLLTEQPLLLGFDESTNWIFIKEAII